MANRKLLVAIAAAAIVAVGSGAAFIAFNGPDGGKTAEAGAPKGPGGPGGPAGARKGGAIGVVAVPATEREFSSKIEALGNLGAKEQVVLSVNAADTVTGVFFEDGQRVKKGQTLLTLKDDEERALLEQAEATAKNARQVFERNTRLAANNAVAQADLDTTRANADAGEANVRSLEAKVRDHTLLAPFDGVLGFRRVSPGAYVQIGQQVATLVDDSEMRLEFGVPSIHLSELHTGVKIEARTADVPDRVFEGTLTSLDNSIDPVTRAVKVRATLPNRDGKMRAGMFMTVDLSPKAHTGLAIPEISIVAEGSDNYVFVVDQTRQPAITVKTLVTVGIREKGVVEVTAGLHAGDLVVTDGVLKVRANGAVKLQGRDQPAKPAQTGQGKPGDEKVAAGEAPSGAADLRQ